MLEGYNTPFLLSLNDMRRCQLGLRTDTAELYNGDGERKKLEKDEKGRFELPWCPISDIMFTEAELRHMHNAYGHGNETSIVRALKEMGYDDLDDHAKAKLEEIR